MVYIAIDDSSKQSKALIEYLSTQKYTHIYSEPNETTKKAIKDSENRKTKNAKNVDDLFDQLLK